MYTLKQQAATHLQNKKYSYAMVYLQDTLKCFDHIIEEELIDEAR